MGVTYTVKGPMPRSTRTFSMMDTKGQAEPTIEEDGTIVSLKVHDQTLKIGDKIKVGTRTYKINHIFMSEEGPVTYYNCMIARMTKSSLFVLPMLRQYIPVIGGNRRNFFFDTYFVNAFVAIPGNDRCIALLYRFSGKKEFIEFEGFLNSLPVFISQFDPNKEMVMYVFEVPYGREDDYDHFLEGRYSHMSPAYKGEILEFHGFNRDGRLAEILYKSPKARARLEYEIDAVLDDDAEVMSIIDMKEETFDPEVYS